jgi:hypothetical protein
VTPQPDKIVPKEQPGRAPEPFLARWSRRKEEARQEAQESAPQKASESKAPPPELPPLEKLTFESDYRGFFHPKVSEDLRRAALKKLFSDPHFNVMDGLDVYIDDYSKTEPIPAAMLASLKQAQRILESAKEDAEQRARENAQAAPAPALDAPGIEPDPGAGITAGMADPIAVPPGDTQTKP